MWPFNKSRRGTGVSDLLRSIGCVSTEGITFVGHGDGSFSMYGNKESAMGFKIELGSTVKDRITGYTGIVHGRTEWLYGCRRYTVQSREMKDGKPVEAMGFDEDALEVIEQAKPHKVKDTGGPQREPSRAATVRR